MASVRRRSGGSSARFRNEPLGNRERGVNAPYPFHAHSAWQGRPLSGLSWARRAVDDPSSATASLWRVSSLNSATPTGGPFSRCPCAAPLRVRWLMIEVASCFYPSFCQACVAGCVAVRRHGSCMPSLTVSCPTSVLPGTTSRGWRARATEA